MSEEQEAVDLGDVGDMGDVAAGVGASDVWDEIMAEEGGQDNSDSGEENADDIVDDDNQEDSTEDDGDIEGDDSDDSEDADDAGESEESDEVDEKAKKPWDVSPDRDEALDSDEFQDYLEATGQTEADFMMKVAKSMSHTLKIRGKESQVPYDKVIAQAQIANASQKKSARMNRRISDGMVVDSIRSGGDDGKLGLKEIIETAKETYGPEDLEEFLADILEIEGKYDNSNDVKKAERDEEYDKHFGDINVDDPRHSAIVNGVTEAIKSFPKEMGDGIGSDFGATRGLYNLEQAGLLPEILDNVESVLRSLPQAQENEIRSNASLYEDLFEEKANEAVNSSQSNQRGTKRSSGSSTRKSKTGTSKTASPPRRSSGKRSKKGSAGSYKFEESGDALEAAARAMMSGGDIL